MAVFFLSFAVLAAMGQLNVIDERIMASFAGMRSDFGTVLMKLITVLADTWVLAVFCAALSILPMRLKLGFPLAGATLVAALLHTLFKFLVARPRPPETLWLVDVSSNSFPSGHANASLVFYLFFMTITRRYLIIHGHRTAANLITGIGPLVVILIGFSRVYLGVHYLSDVIGGWLLGSILLIITITLYDSFWPIKYRITYDPPAWKDPLRKGRKWKHPAPRDREIELLEFPNARGPWRHPRVASKREQKEQRVRRVQKREDGKDRARYADREDEKDRARYADREDAKDRSRYVDAEEYITPDDE